MPKTLRTENGVSQPHMKATPNQILNAHELDNYEDGIWDVNISTEKDESSPLLPMSKQKSQSQFSKYGNNNIFTIDEKKDDDEENFENIDNNDNDNSYLIQNQFSILLKRYVRLTICTIVSTFIWLILISILIALYIYQANTCSEYKIFYMRFMIGILGFIIITYIFWFIIRIITLYFARKMRYVFALDETVTSMNINKQDKSYKENSDDAIIASKSYFRNLLKYTKWSTQFADTLQLGFFLADFNYRLDSIKRLSKKHNIQNKKPNKISQNNIYHHKNTLNMAFDHVQPDGDIPILAHIRKSEVNVNKENGPNKRKKPKMYIRKSAIFIFVVHFVPIIGLISLIFVGNYMYSSKREQLDVFPTESTFGINNSSTVISNNTTYTIATKLYNHILHNSTDICVISYLFCWINFLIVLVYCSCTLIPLIITQFMV